MSDPVLDFQQNKRERAPPLYVQANQRRKL